MSDAVSNTNYEASALHYVADTLDLDRDEVNRVVRAMQHDPWLDAPVTRCSPGALPEAEDGRYKYHHVDV